jgi:hypothetical protein
MTNPDARRIRRDAVERLAAAVRALADATVETAVDPELLDDITCEIEGLTRRLEASTHESPYSGLTLAQGDFSVPEGPIPLSPIIGSCSPVRPDVQLRVSNGEIAGRASFTKRFVGLPGFVHGGISAMLADQIVAVSAQAIGVRTITKSVHVRYRRPLPLGEEVAVEGTADLVSYERLAGREESTTRE